MNPTQEAINRTRKAITEAIRQSDVEARFLCPAPVWDNTGQMIGALIQSDVRMGDQDCTAEVSFVVNVDEGQGQIAEKAETAINAIRFRMLAKVRSASGRKSVDPMIDLDGVLRLIRERMQSPHNDEAGYRELRDLLKDMGQPE